MNKIGFEKEYFLENKKKELVIDPARYGYETDNLGVLVEVRGKPDVTVADALASLLAKEIVAKARASAKGWTLVEKNFRKLSDEEILRITDKYHNMLSDKLKSIKRNKSSRVEKSFKITRLTAGLHIHFSKETREQVELVNITTNVNSTNKDGEVNQDSKIKVHYKDIVANTFLDMPLIIRTLDEAFAKVIKKSGRTAGAYEMKDWGFEYRSLPNTVSLEKVAGICNKILNMDI